MATAQRKSLLTRSVCSPGPVCSALPVATVHRNHAVGTRRRYGRNPVTAYVVAAKTREHADAQEDRVGADRLERRRAEARTRVDQRRVRRMADENRIGLPDPPGTDRRGHFERFDDPPVERHGTAQADRRVRDFD